MAIKAEIEIVYLEDFTSRVYPKMIKAGMEVLEPIVKRELEKAIGSNLKHKSRSTGSLIESVKVSNTFVNAQRFKQNIYFEGKDSKGVSQGAKAAFKEYGTSRGQEASHFTEIAVRATKSRVIAAMAQVLENELKT